MPLSRSEIMRRVKARDTKPELRLRSLLRALGHPGYRLDRKELPGRPDIAYIGRRRAIFVHGCFWHGHDCKRGAREPKANAAYWRAKIARNRARDAASVAALEHMGWRVLVIWECEMRDDAALTARLRCFIETEGRYDRSRKAAPPRRGAGVSGDPPIAPARLPRPRRPRSR